MRLRYVGIRVRDLERSLRFYTQALGLREVHRGDMGRYGGGRGVFVLLRDEASGQQLELNWYPPGSAFATEYVPGEGLDHLGFVVDDVEAEYLRLLEQGAQPTGVDPASTRGFQACVTDPDGNWIELVVEP